MDMTDTWVGLLPMNETGRPLLTLEKAGEIARREKAGWCVSPSDGGCTVSKVQRWPVYQHHHIANEKNEPMSFSNVEHAVSFLQRELNVCRVIILPWRQAALDR